MPDFPLIDAHVHLWDPATIRMPWLDGDTLLDHPFLPATYREHTQGIAVEHFVYVETDVEPHYALVEAAWVNTLAEQEPRLAGIVAHAPLEYGERVRSYLDALVSMGPHIKGVRRLLQSEADPAYCLQPDFVCGVQLLAEYQLSFDIGIRHPQLPAVIQMARQCPGTACMLDHIGKPTIKAHELDPWREQIAELAALPNVYCKISGLVTEADLKRWTAEDLAPYVEHILATFGEDRVVFGSDWPVALHATSYSRWVETLDMLTVSLSVEARRKLWAENARAFYRLVR